MTYEVAQKAVSQVVMYSIILRILAQAFQKLIPSMSNISSLSPGKIAPVFVIHIREAV